MIRIIKPSQAPAILNGRGAQECQILCDAYESGVTEFEFDREIYGHKTVKDALILTQHDKCFLCESKICHIDYGDVEHFRPKKAYRQSDQEKLSRPGYYWLAYDWENLFLACTLCNQRHKGNLFPLENLASRATSHLADWKAEKPLFINPVEENPEDFISFKVDKLLGVLPYAVENNPKGVATIKGAGIDREKLCQSRMELLKFILALHQVAKMNLPQPESDQAKDILQSIVDDCTADSHQYAGMFRAAVRTNFLL